MAEKKFVPTYGKFVLTGIITGKDKPREGFGYREGFRKDGNVDIPYRSMKFTLKTTTNDYVPVEIYGEVKNKLTAKNKKEGKEIAIAWDKRNDELPEGFYLVKQDYDKAAEINDNFKDGDRIYIYGQLRYKEFQNKKGNFIEGTTFNIGNIGIQTKDTETNEFTQPLVVESLSEDENKNLLLHVKIIANDKGKNCTATFKVERKPGDEKDIASVKKLSFGDALIVEGFVKYRPLKEPVEKKDTGLWDNETDPDEEVVNGFDKSLVIAKFIGKSLEKGKYTKDDFKAVNNTVQSDYDGTSDAAQKVAEILKAVEAEPNNGLPFLMDDDE
jgi:hypothetical protein